MADNKGFRNRAKSGQKAMPAQWQRLAERARTERRKWRSKSKKSRLEFCRYRIIYARGLWR